MERNDDVFSAVEGFAHVFNLIGEYVRQGHFHCRRQIDNHFIVWSRLPDIDYRVADVSGKLHFRSGKAFRRIFKLKFSLRIFFSVFVHQLCAVRSDLNDFLFRCAEHLLPLGERGGIVQVNNSPFCAF